MHWVKHNLFVDGSHSGEVHAVCIIPKCLSAYCQACGSRGQSLSLNSTPVCELSVGGSSKRLNWLGYRHTLPQSYADSQSFLERRLFIAPMNT